MKKKLAIIGCGSSGLITLKYALEELSDWQVVAYEATSCITGCWGRQPSGFVSTSTKYTTQFACYPLYDARVHRNLSANVQTGRYPDFFCDGQYGVYLEEFAAKFGLMPHISLRTSVSHVEQNQEGKWILRLSCAQDERVCASALAITPFAVFHRTFFATACSCPLTQVFEIPSASGSSNSECDANDY